MLHEDVAVGPTTIGQVHLMQNEWQEPDSRSRVMVTLVAWHT